MVIQATKLRAVSRERRSPDYGIAVVWFFTLLSESLTAEA